MPPLSTTIAEVDEAIVLLRAALDEALQGKGALGRHAQPKELGFWMCTALVVGNTIGMGIFVLPASLAPYGFNAMLGWGVTVLGMTMLARVFAQLAREFPAADGPYTYIEQTTGKLPAYIAVWCYWVSCWITNAALAIGLVGYLGKVLPDSGPCRRSCTPSR